MAGSSNNQYLESKVLSASQPRLHLMLLEGAVRHCRTAQQAGVESSWGEFAAAVGKAMDIVEELVRSVKGQRSEISPKLEEQYVFLFCELAACRFSLDLEKLDTSAKLLDFQRETWRLVCESTEAPAANRAPVVAPHFRADPISSSGSFSFEA